MEPDDDLRDHFRGLSTHALHYLIRQGDLEPRALELLHEELAGRDAPPDASTSPARAALGTAVAPSAGVDADMLANRGPRLIARLIDYVLPYIIFLVPTWFASAVAGDGQNLILSAVAMGLLIVAVPSAIAYALFADGLPGGQSVGKRILAIRVVDEATGAPCTYRQSFIRNIVLGMGSFIDALFIFGARRQRLGDLAARTIVTNVPSRGYLS